MSEIQTEQTALQAAQLETQPALQGVFDKNTLAVMSRMADRFANSSMVPQSYQKKPDDCFVAVEMAARLGVSPLVVMQNLYVVQGRPSWSGQGAIALINGSGMFTPLDFTYVGERGTDSWGCYCSATRLRDGKFVQGTTVSMQLAKDEGWSTKAGSKWKTMPDQMLMYRAASFFARVHCPNVLMGYQTVEEVQDVRGYEQPQKEKIVFTVDAEVSE